MYKAEPLPNQIPVHGGVVIKHSIYSLMCKLLQRMFSFVAISVPSKRLFSTTGNVIIDKHKQLTYEQADQLIFHFENCN